MNCCCRGCRCCCTAGLPPGVLLRTPNPPADLEAADSSPSARWLERTSRGQVLSASGTQTQSSRPANVYDHAPPPPPAQASQPPSCAVSRMFANLLSTMFCCRRKPVSQPEVAHAQAQALARQTNELMIARMLAQSQTQPAGSHGSMHALRKQLCHEIRLSGSSPMHTIPQTSASGKSIWLTGPPGLE